MEGLLQFLPTFLIDTIAKIFSFEGPFEEAYSFDFVQVLRYGGLGEPYFIYKVVADTIVLLADIFQDGDPGRVRQDLGNLCQLVMGQGKNMCFGSSHIL